MDMEQCISSRLGSCSTANIDLQTKNNGSHSHHSHQTEYPINTPFPTDTCSRRTPLPWMGAGGSAAATLAPNKSMRSVPGSVGRSSTSRRGRRRADRQHQLITQTFTHGVPSLQIRHAAGNRHREGFLLRDVSYHSSYTYHALNTTDFCHTLPSCRTYYIPSSMLCIMFMLSNTVLRTVVDPRTTSMHSSEGPRAPCTT